MRYISDKKQKGPDQFEDWKALANDDWQPCYEDLQNPEKESLHSALLAEQAWLCCYCGRKIDRSDSHIEHFRPQESYPELALSYANLHASCIRESAPGMPRHCGHGKGKDFDENLHISPTDATCEARFMYTWDGQILPKSEVDEPARYMCRLLKLDIKSLESRRKSVIGNVFDETFNTDELRLLIDAFRKPGTDGCLEDMAHVVARYAEQALLATAG